MQSLEQIKEFKNRQSVAVKDDRLTLNDRYLSNPISDYRLVKKIKWDVDSPKFNQALINLGL